MEGTKNSATTTTTTANKKKTLGETKNAMELAFPLPTLSRTLKRPMKY